MSQYALFAKRIGLVGAVQLVSSFRGLITLPILVLGLGVAGYGLFSLVLAGMTLIIPVVFLGLPSALVRFLASETDKNQISRSFSTVFFAILFVALLSALIIFCASSSIANLIFKDPSASIIVQIASWLIFLDALDQVSSAPFRVFGKIKTYSALTLLQTILEVGLLVVAVLTGFGLVGAIVALLVTRAIITIFSLVLLAPYCRIGKPDFSLLQPYLRFGIPLIPSVLFEVILSVSDRYVIEFFRGAAEVGIYSASYNLASVVLFPIGPITYILSPYVFKFHDEGDEAKVALYLSYSLKYALLVTIPIVFGVAVLTGPVLRLLTTQQFAVAGMIIAPIIAISLVFEIVRNLYGHVLMLHKITKIFAVASISAGILNITLNIVFVPFFGIFGAACVNLFSYFVLGLVMYLNARKLLKFGPNVGLIGKMIASATAMAILILAINPTGIIMILIAVALGSGVYFFFFYALRGFEKPEIEVIMDIVGVKRFL